MVATLLGMTGPQLPYHNNFLKVNTFGEAEDRFRTKRDLNRFPSLHGFGRSSLAGSDVGRRRNDRPG
jgi:hypothetical protein